MAHDLKVSEATGPALDWMVARCEGWDSYDVHSNGQLELERTDTSECLWLRCFTPSTDWAQGGPIIDREFIFLTGWRSPERDVRVAAIETATQSFTCMGPTSLIAAMRCFVVCKLGDIVKVPKEMNHGA